MKTLVRNVMTTFFLATLIALAIFMSFAAFAQETVGTTTSTQQESLEATSTQIAVITAKIDLIEGLNSKILNVVYWTLGVLATIFAALVTVNLYVNIRVNQREIERIKEDSLKKTESEVAAAEARVLEKIREEGRSERESMKVNILETVGNEIASSQAEALKKVSEQNSKEFETMKSDILATAKNEVLAAEARAIEKINQFDKAKTSSIVAVEGRIDSIQRDLKSLRVTVGELEIDRFESKGQQGAIIRRVELLEMDIDEKNDWRISSRLVSIRDYLQEHRVRSSVATKLSSVLKKLKGKEEYSQLVDEVTKSTRIFED